MPSPIPNMITTLRAYTRHIHDGRDEHRARASSRRCRRTRPRAAGRRRAGRRARSTITTSAIGSDNSSARCASFSASSATSSSTNSSPPTCTSRRVDVAQRSTRPSSTAAPSVPSSSARLATRLPSPSRRRRRSDRERTRRDARRSPRAPSTHLVEHRRTLHDGRRSSRRPARVASRRRLTCSDSNDAGLVEVGLEGREQRAGGARVRADRRATRQT